MAVTAQQVKELRERSGAGMMECKKALVESDGDMEAAIEQLRKSGLAKADKKSARVAAEGIITIAEDDTQAVLIEINCETDFVAKDDAFRAFVSKVEQAALNSTGDEINDLLVWTDAAGNTLEQARQELVAVIGENIQVRRLLRMSRQGQTVASYIHGARIGVLVAIDGAEESVARDIAMHIAAFSPAYISADDVPADVLEKEQKILTAQAADSGKPADIIEKMVQGRLRKQIEEITLHGQPFVKDNDISVGKWLQQQGVSVLQFSRLAVGEGIEKENVDFASEVMQQVKAS
jgi:elongation factor Ts